MSAHGKAWLGVVVWAAFVGTRVPGLHHDAWAHALLLFAALVIVPLALELFDETGELGAAPQWLAIVRLLQAPASILLAVSCWLAPGAMAATAALPWVLWTALLAIVGLMRIRAGGVRRPLDRLCADAAMVFTAVGGAWTFADRFAYAPLRFDAQIVALTAVHFHYAGLLLPLFAGLVQRELFFWRLASRAAVGVVLGVPAVAFGITATQLRWGTSLETATALWLSLAGLAVAILHVRLALDLRRDVATRVLLGVAGASLFFGMVLAALYALRANTTFAPWLGIPQMRMLHGTTNAIGFGLCGVLAWRRISATAHRESTRASGGD